jgi:hypothetical protein
MSSSHSDQIAENPITCEGFVYSLEAFRDDEMTPPDRRNNCQRLMFAMAAYYFAAGSLRVALAQPVLEPSVTSVPTSQC